MKFHAAGRLEAPRGVQHASPHRRHRCRPAEGGAQFCLVGRLNFESGASAPDTTFRVDDQNHSDYELPSPLYLTITRTRTITIADATTGTATICWHWRVVVHAANISITIIIIKNA